MYNQTTKATRGLGNGGVLGNFEQKAHGKGQKPFVEAGVLHVPTGKAIDLQRARPMAPG